MAGVGKKQPLTVDGVDYPSKTAAIMALLALGTLSQSQIGAKVGSDTGSVGAIISQQRRKVESAKAKASDHRPDATPGLWTPEKRDKVRRLFGKTMILIADSVRVPPAELLTYVLHGVIPPSQAVSDPDDIRWQGEAASGSGPGQPLTQLPAPTGGDDSQILPRESFEGSDVDPPADDVIDGDALVDEDPPQAMPLSVNLQEPSDSLDRDDDEAELAALAWVDDPEATYNILLLIGDVDVSRAEVDGWSAEQRREAEEWAGAVHTSASDNDDVVVPPRPDFVRNLPLPPASATVMEVTPREAHRFQEPAPAVPRSVAKPAVGEVRLIDETGRYLHESLDGMTTNPRFAWKGDAAKLKAVQNRLPHTRQLDTVPV